MSLLDSRAAAYGFGLSVWKPGAGFFGVCCLCADMLACCCGTCCVPAAHAALQVGWSAGLG